MNALAAAAQWYAKKGWPVFPCVPGGKKPLTGHGYQDATTDPATVRAWWDRWPDANIGIATGAAGLVVVDCDVKNGAPGLESWRDLRGELGFSDATPTVETPSGGLHIYYLANGRNISCSASKLAPGVDIRAQGGYVVAPPSRTPLGTYGWALGCRPTELALLPLPKPLSELESDNGQRTAPPIGDGIPQGQRNATLASLAGSMRRRGMSQEAIEAALLVENTRCSPPMPEGEVLAVAASIGRYAPAAEGDPPPALPGWPRLDAGIRTLQILSDMAWNALLAANDPPRLFLHGGGPSRLEHGEEGPALRPLTADALRHEAARSADWYSNRKVDGVWREVPAQPPKDTIVDMLAYPAEALRLPPLDRIVGAPVYAADGTLQAMPGYHPAGRVFVNTDMPLPSISSSPTTAEVQAAVALFDELVADFPFCNGADRAGAFALALLPFVRDMIDGPTPLHLIEAPAAGTGKGLLAAALLMPALGDGLGSMTQGRDEDEWRKRITTRLREGKAALLIDNLTQPLDSGTLSSALTAWPFWGDRQLGTLEALNLPVRCAWVATANNPVLSTEIARRCVRIRIDAKQDRPFQREPSAFVHPDLRTWARAERSNLTAAALTLAQSWIGAGRPAPKVRPLGSYEAWTRVIGGILEHAGIKGFLTNLDELYERADQEGAVWRRFVEAWWEAHKDSIVGVADLYTIAVKMEDFPLGKGQERAQKTSLGMGLGKRRDMVLGGYRIESAGVTHRLQQWRLTPTQIQGAVYLGVPSVPFRSSPEMKNTPERESENVRLGTPGTPSDGTEPEEDEWLTF
jgi:hypothetical protein